MKHPDSCPKSYIRSISKPCTRGCQQAISAFGIKNVIYTTEEGFDWL
jgi:hypothetical protein